MAGLFFCLASTKGARLLFCPDAMQPRASVYSAFCTVYAVYTTHAVKQRTGLYNGFSCNFTHSTAHDTKPTQQAIAQPATRWSAYQRPDALHRYQIPPPHRALYRPAQPPIIIRYIRVQGCAPVMDPCQTVQQIADHASRVGSAPTVYESPASADTLSAVHTRRDSPAAGARRAARNHWRLPPYLFSGFRPIANRGQQ